MSEDINKKIQKQRFFEIAKKIEDIKKPVSSALGGVLIYEENNINYISAKLFNTKLSSISQNDVDNAHIFIQSYRNKLSRLKDELLQDPLLNKPQKKILLNIIQGNILRLLLLYYATYIEAEKGGFSLDPKKKTEYLQKIEKLETIIYGPSVTSQKEEKRKILYSLETLFTQKSDLLNEEQKKIFSSFLESFPDRPKLHETKKEKEKEKELEKQIPIMEVCHIFKKIADLYGFPSIIIKIDPNKEKDEEIDGILYIPQSYDQEEKGKVIDKRGLRKTVKIYLDPRVSGFGIGDYTVDIPAHRESISLRRLCGLIDHEMNTHFLRMANTKKFLNIKNEGSLEIEEGIAVLNDKLITEKAENITVDDPLISNVALFIAEHNDLATTEKILYSYYLLLGNTPKDAEGLAHQRALRAKRYHAFDIPGANRKDVVYRRGLVDAVAYIQSLDKEKIEDLKKLEKDMITFYVSRLNKEDFQNADELFTGFDIDTGNIVLPIAIGKILYQRLLGNKIDTIDDIRFLTSKQKLNYKQKKIFMEIYSLIKNIPEKKE